MTLAIEMAPGDLDGAQLALSPELYAQPLADLIRDASVAAVREAQSGSSGLGGIPSSIAAKVTPLSAEISTAHPGALVLESGRRVGAKLPPLESLSRYAPIGQRFPIARAISRRGIKGRFFMKKAFDSLDRAELPRLIRLAQEKIGARWAEQ